MGASGLSRWASGNSATTAVNCSDAGQNRAFQRCVQQALGYLPECKSRGDLRFVFGGFGSPGGGDRNPTKWVGDWDTFTGALIFTGSVREL